jgi:lipid-binding SYLF domain-containing protein
VIIEVYKRCKKAAKILTSFVDPRQSFGPDKVIPPEILANAKADMPHTTAGKWALEMEKTYCS